MKSVVISGSASLQEDIFKWKEYFESIGYFVLDYPKAISEEKFRNEYPDIHKDFFKNITNCDILFIMNEDKNGKEGYIGASTYAEISFGVAQNLLYDKNIEIIINKMPEESVQSYQEIKLWLNLGWIKLSTSQNYKLVLNSKRVI